ncbi:hypothetical protein [Psychromonas sp.]|uniref:hypothetical protein n=1 Tax=Psychromonas sp. TaxID=1884585 RepID=UPI0035618940
MNIKKSKIVLALGGLIFLAAPLGSAFAHEQHCEIEDTQLGNTMKYIKSELRAYVKGFKNDDPQKMQQHLNELIKLSSIAAEQTPVKIKKMHDHDMPMAEMDHSQMDMSGMAEMDHSQMDMSGMAEMDHAQMDMSGMSEMDHSQMDMSGMAEMDHSQMDMSGMAELDHSQMEHSQMASPQHDMASMPGMEGMSNEQHHQHMMYVEGINELKELFKQLEKTQGTEQIKTVLGQIKEHSKKSHQQFRQDCN